MLLKIVCCRVLVHNLQDTFWHMVSPDAQHARFRYVILYLMLTHLSLLSLSVFSEESWGPWQQWSLCSVSCGEGVRERVRECLLPSGVGGLRCTGMVKEQSICSLEDCVGQSPPFSCFSLFVLQFSLQFYFEPNRIPCVHRVAYTFSITPSCTCRDCTLWW